jgi:cation-transporting ATPase E
LAIGSAWFRRHRAELARVTGMAFAPGDPFAAAAAHAVAQSLLSVFLTLTAFVVILFLAPPAGFFVGFAHSLSRDRRPAIMAGALAVVLLTILSVPPLADYFGLLPVTPAIYAVLAFLLTIWALAVRQSWRRRWLERFLRL